MKKISIIAAFLLIIGITGTVMSMQTTVDKINTYLDEKRKELYINEELLNTDKEVKLLKVNVSDDLELSNRVILNIKKSDDNNVKVTVDSKCGKGVYLAEVDNGNLSLSVDKKNKNLNLNLSEKYIEHDKGVIGGSFGLIKGTEEAKDIMKETLGMAASSGTKIVRRGFSITTDSPTKRYFSYENTKLNTKEYYDKTFNVVNVYLPKSINLEVLCKENSAFLMPINIDENMINEFIRSDNSYITKKVSYKSKLKKLIIDSYGSFSDFNFEDYNAYADDKNNRPLMEEDEKLRINTMVINTAPKSLVKIDRSNTKVADEVLINIDKNIKIDEKKHYEYNFYGSDFLTEIDRESNVYELINQELKNNINHANKEKEKKYNEDEDEAYIESDMDDALMTLENDMDNKLSKVSFYEELKTKLGDNENAKNLIDIFKKDIADYYLNIQKNSFENMRNFGGFDFSILVARGMSDKIKINADGYKAKLYIEKFNPDLKLEASDNLDLRYILYGKLGNDKIIQRMKDKKYEGSLKNINYLDNTDKSISEKPSIEIKAKYLRVVN